MDKAPGLRNIKQEKKAMSINYKDSIIKPTIIITLVTLCSALLLSHVNKITDPRIQAYEKAKEDNAITVVLPGYEVGPEETVTIDGKPFSWRTGTHKTAGTPGYAFKGSAPGYSGDMVSMIGIDDQGKILGLVILQQSETPGLGARCLEVPSKYTLFDFLFSSAPMDDDFTTPWFQDQFQGIDTGRPIILSKESEWNISLRERLLERNAVTVITGATITTRTVVTSLAEATARLKKALDEKNNQNNKGDK
jgi:Na+-translocating ferredoxin:NAD+ oxidoreductase subunit G